MNCLVDLIGVKGVCDQALRPGAIMLDGLPGVSLRRAAKVTDEEIRGADFLAKIIQEGVALTIQEFRAKLGEYYNFESIVDSARVGKQPSEYNSIHAGKIGVEIEKLTTDQFQQLYINEVVFFSAENATATFYIEDGCVVKSFDVSLNCGRNVIPIDYCATTCSVTISVDWGGAIPTAYGCTNSCSCLRDYGCDVCTSSCFNVRGFLQDTSNNKTYTGNLNGFSVLASCRCSTEELICRYADELKYAARYRVGILFMEFQRNSTNTNLFVQNSDEQIEFNLIRWGGGTNKFSGLTEKGLYQEAIELAVNSILPSLKNQKTSCISCSKKTLKTVKSIP